MGEVSQEGDTVNILTVEGDGGAWTFFAYLGEIGIKIYLGQLGENQFFYLGQLGDKQFFKLGLIKRKLIFYLGN